MEPSEGKIVPRHLVTRKLVLEFTQNRDSLDPDLEGTHYWPIGPTTRSHGFEPFVVSPLPFSHPAPPEETLDLVTRRGRKENPGTPSSVPDDEGWT